MVLCVYFALFHFKGNYSISVCSDDCISILQLGILCQCASNANVSRLADITLSLASVEKYVEFLGTPYSNTTRCAIMNEAGLFCFACCIAYGLVRTRNDDMCGFSVFFFIFIFNETFCIVGLSFRRGEWIYFLFSLAYYYVPNVYFFPFQFF